MGVPPHVLFDQLLTNEQDFLHALIRTIGVPVSDAADVLQSSNIYLIKNADKFIPGTNFRAWSAKVARYRCLGYFRSQKIRPMVNLSEQAIDLIAEEACHQYDETADQLAKLKNCLSQLPSKHSDLIHAIYNEGQTLKDYASIQNKSHSAIRKTISRIRQSLKDCIESLQQ